MTLGLGYLPANTLQWHPLDSKWQRQARLPFQPLN